MPVVPLPAPTPDAIVVVFDTGAANAALTALDELLDSVHSLRVTELFAGGTALYHWTGGAADWFREQHKGTPESLSAVRTTIGGTILAIHAAAKRAADQQILHNAYADQQREKAELEAAEAAPAGGN